MKADSWEEDIHTVLKTVHTDTFCLGGVSDESLVTSAAVASYCVLTAAVLTDSRFHHTLIQV